MSAGWVENEEDIYGYAVRMIEDAKELDLRELHSYLVGTDEIDATTEAEPWKDGQLRLFVSHLASRQEFVGTVSTHLAYEGVSAFVAHTSIDPSREWQDVIETALRSCDAMVVFLHDGFHESYWCDQEVGFALARRTPVYLVAMGAMPYGFMSKYQALKAADMPPPQIATRITDWLASTSTSQAAMTEGR